MNPDPNIRSAADQARVAPQPVPQRYDAPNVGQSSETTASIVIPAVCGAALVMCGGLCFFIMVPLAAIQIIGRNANSAFGTVGASIGTTVTAGTVASPREQAAEQVVRAYIQDLGANEL